MLLQRHITNMTVGRADLQNYGDELQTQKQKFDVPRHSGWQGGR